MTLPHPTIPPRQPLGTAITRTLSGNCPNCGKGRLFRTYLKQVERCAECDEGFGHIRSDDAAPWLTILVVGHLLVPIVLLVERENPWPEWVAMTLWPSIGLLMCLLMLPRAKALFLGLIWWMRAPGSERK
ncbi:MAG: DUF983 domain-containing protein [Alphaproteobacteria bacterium]